MRLKRKIHVFADVSLTAISDGKCSPENVMLARITCIHQSYASLFDLLI